MSRFARADVLRWFTWVSLLAMLVVAFVPAAAVAQGEEGYRLGPGDKLRVTVFGEPYLSGEFIVSASSTISMPLIPTIPVGGATLPEAADLIEQALRAGFLGDPKIAVEVLEYRPFFVIGEVRNPGSFPYVADMTVLHAVAIAGGFTPRAAKRRIVIQRDGEDIENVEHTTRVQPDDIITVRERFF